MQHVQDAEILKKMMKTYIIFTLKIYLPFSLKCVALGKEIITSECSSERRHIESYIVED